MLPLVGGKAANLGELTRAGLPVPPGFCVTTEAYRRGRRAARPRRLLDRLAASAAADDVPALTALAGRARAALLAAPIPAASRDAVADGYAGSATTCRSRCARRPPPRTCRSPASPASRTPTSTSSARTPCSTPCAAAGPRCGPTAPSPTAPRNGIDHRAVRLAVVVQRMVDAAGRRRAVHRQPGHRPPPRGGHRRQPRPRRGRRLRRGQPRPLRGRHRDRARSSSAGSATSGWRSGAARRRHASTSSATPAPTRPASPTTQVRALAALGDRVEAHYGAPQDTEWAIDADGTLWLTQARPITTLYPLPDGAPGAGRGPAGVLLLQRRPGPVPAVHADGPGRVPAARPRRPRGCSASRSPTRSPGRRVRRGRAAALRRPHRRRCAAGSAARSCRGCSTSWRPARRRSCARLFDDPRFSRRPSRSPLPFVRRVAAARAPLPDAARASLQALVSPDAARRRAWTGSAPSCAAGSRLPGDATAAERLDLRRDACSSTTVIPLVPRDHARSRRPGSPCSALAGRLLRRPTPSPASCRPCCAACRTT